jgi:hypothetical protein
MVCPALGTASWGKLKRFLTSNSGSSSGCTRRWALSASSVLLITPSAPRVTAMPLSAISTTVALARFPVSSSCFLSFFDGFPSIQSLLSRQVGITLPRGLVAR